MRSVHHSNEEGLDWTNEFGTNSCPIDSPLTMVAANVARKLFDLGT